MAIDYLVTDTELSDIADAIRAKGGTSASISFPNGFTTAIAAIPTGITPTGTKSITITQNGTTTENVTNYASAEINVQIPTYAGAHHPAITGKTVTITLTNPVNPSSFGSCFILEQLSSIQGDTGNTLGSIDSPTGSTTVVVDNDIYGVAIYINGLSVGYGLDFNVLDSGGVTLIGVAGAGDIFCQVTGDGSIVINGVDYDD